MDPVSRKTAGALSVGDGDGSSLIGLQSPHRNDIIRTRFRPSPTKGLRSSTCQDTRAHSWLYRQRCRAKCPSWSTFSGPFLYSLPNGLKMSGSCRKLIGLPFFYMFLWRACHAVLLGDERLQCPLAGPRQRPFT